MINKSTNLVPFDWNKYYKFDADLLVKKFASESTDFFKKSGENMAYKLFHDMAQYVPAYKNFLKKNKINHTKIKTLKDMDNIPWIDKNNYLKKYDLKDLAWGGKINSPIISASSGSTGIPTFWPRSDAIEMETTYIYELFLRYLFDAGSKSTLFINGFAMGIYVGGSFTLTCSMRLAQKGMPLTIVTPGMNKKEIIQSYESLYKYYDQIIIGTYPPLLRDILDDMTDAKIPIKNGKVKFFLATESFSEEFRKYLYSKVGIGQKDYYRASLNLYGTADAAIAGHETPLSIFVRDLFSKSQKRTHEYFKESYVPSLNMYYPFFKHFQIIGDEIIFSSYNNHSPLFKYNIHDRGALLSYDDMIELVKSFGVTESEMKKITDWKNPWKLPYVYLFGRSDFTVKLYGALIEPETLRKALEKKELYNFVTSKFTMVVKYDDKQRQYLEVNVELRPKAKESEELRKKIQQSMVTELLKENIEYRATHAADAERNTPRIVFWHYEDPMYFAPSIKQKWLKKD